MKVEVGDLGSVTLIVRTVSVNVNTELRSCVKVKVDVIGSLILTDSPYGLYGRKTTLNSGAV